MSDKIRVQSVYVNDRFGTVKRFLASGHMMVQFEDQPEGFLISQSPDEVNIIEGNQP